MAVGWIGIMTMFSYCRYTKRHYINEEADAGIMGVSADLPISLAVLWPNFRRSACWINDQTISIDLVLTAATAGRVPTLVR